MHRTGSHAVDQGEGREGTRRPEGVRVVVLLSYHNANKKSFRIRSICHIIVIVSYVTRTDVSYGITLTS